MQILVDIAPRVFGGLGSARESLICNLICMTQTAYVRRGARWGRLAVLGHLGDIVIVFKSRQPKTARGESAPALYLYTNICYYFTLMKNIHTA